MAIVNFSVPTDVKRSFDRAFAGQNKSAVIARLMREAVDERRRTRRRLQVMDALVAMRRRARSVSSTQVRRARTKGRP